MDSARAPWTSFWFRLGMTKYDRRWRHSLCTIRVILSTNVITLRRETKTENALEAQLKHWESKTPLPRRMEEFRLRMTVFLATVVLPLLTVKGELSTWEQEGLQREWSAGLSRSSHRAHWKAGFPPLFVFGEPSREQARGAWEGRVLPQFVSQDKTTGQWIKLVYFIGTGLLSRRFM